MIGVLERAQLLVEKKNGTRSLLRYNLPHVLTGAFGQPVRLRLSREWNMHRKLQSPRKGRSALARGLRHVVAVGFVAFFFCCWTEATAAETSGKDADHETASEMTGRVIGSDGQPAAQAMVHVRSPARSVELDTRATTDGEGRFTVPMPATLPSLAGLRVHASNADGSQLGVYRFPTGGEATLADPIEISLEPSKTATIRVIGADGNPVVDASVAAVLRYPQVQSGLTTDASGTATLRLPQSERINAVVAWKDDVGLDYRVYRLSRDQQADVNAKTPEFPAEGEETLTLSGTSPLTVQVTDDAEQPLAGVQLYPWLLRKDSEPEHLNLSYLAEDFSQQTDAEGATTFRWFPDWQTSVVTIWATADGFDRARGEYEPLIGEQRLEMQLERPVPIRGRVVDSDGQPQSNLTVVARGAGYDSGSASASATTDDSGHYELLVSPNHLYLVVVRDSDWVSAARDGFVVLKNQPVENVDFTLRKPTRIFGTLTNEETEEPLGGQRVYVYQYGRDLHSLDEVELPNPENSSRYVRPTLVHSTTTDEEGRFELWLGDGQFDIRPPKQEKAEKFEIAGESEMEFDITTVVRKEVELVGKLAAEDDGAPIAGARVTGVSRDFRGRDWQAVSNADGEFRVKRFRDPTYVHAQSSDGKWAAIGEVGADDDAVSLKLQRVGSASGRLLTTDSEAPKGRTKVRYGVRVPSSDEQTWSNRFGGVVITEPDGTFQLEGLVPGWEYDLNLEFRSNGTIPQLTKLTVEPGESVDLSDLPEPKPRERYTPPTLEDRIERAFAVEGTPLQRHERALELIDLVNQHLLVVFGAPDDSHIHRLMELRYEDSDFRPFRDEFRFMAIPTDGANREPALALADKLGVSLANGRHEFFLVLLDREGELVATADKASLGADEKLSKEKLFDWLRPHLGDQPDAKQLLSDALKRAAEEDKRVIVQETATWCGPCHMLARFLDGHRVWEKDYIWVKMDHRYNGARELMMEIRDGADGGIPWFAILDPDGNVLVKSNDRETERNIGYPSSESGQQHFAYMLNETRKRMSEDDVKQLVDALAEENAKD